MMSGNAEQSFQSVEIINRAGDGPAVILCEHASHDIPKQYQQLGVDSAHLRSHAAWDPGAYALAKKLAQKLDAPVVASLVSRLVYDCNRPPEAASAMPERSEIIDIPGNRNLTIAQRAKRINAVYRPFCDAVTAVLADRQARNIPTVLITIHSFTPIYHGQPRMVEIGILHETVDCRLADAMLAQAYRLPHRRIERNTPYGPEDGVTHSLQLHGLRNGLANVMIEVRNDLLQTPNEREIMAVELLTLIHPALATLGLASIWQGVERNA